MAYYRLYFLNSDGRIGSAVELDRATDSEATLTASRYGSPFGTELWHLDRLVQAFAPTTTGGPDDPPPSGDADPDEQPSAP